MTWDPVADVPALAPEALASFDRMVAAVAAVGADRVELYTEPYAAAHGTPEHAAVLARYVAAAEAAIGLAIVVIYFRNRGTIEVEDISTLKG